MTKVYGMHDINLHPGVQGEDFEQFFRERVASMPLYPGWRWRLLKGEKGAKVGQYMLLFEIESIEARDRFAPPSGEMSQAAAQHLEAHKETFSSVNEQWATFTATPLGQSPTFTDYIATEV